MLYELLVRATELLAELEAAPLSGTTFNAAEDIPQMIQDMEGYIAFMSNPSFTQDNTGNKMRLSHVTFPGLLVGAQILTGNSFTDRSNLLKYADLIATKFNERSLLQNSAWDNLDGVRECVFIGGRVFEGAYPLNQNDIIRRQFSFSLDIEFLRLVTTHR